METYNAASWLLDRHIATGLADHVAVRCRGQDVTYGDVQRRGVAGPARARRPRRRPRPAGGDRASTTSPRSLAWFLGCTAAGVVAGSALDDAHRRRRSPRSSPTRRRAGSSSRPSTSDVVEPVRSARRSDPCRPRRRCPTTARTMHRRRDVTVDGVHRRHRDAGGRHHGGIAGVLAVQSGTTGVPKGVMHRHGNLQATADTYARTVLEVTPDDRFLSVAKLFFAYGLGNSLTFPLRGRRHRRSSTPTGRRRRRSVELAAAEAADAVLRQPRLRRRHCSTPTSTRDAFASVRAAVTAGEALPADLQRRFRSASATPCSTASARPRRCTSSCPTARPSSEPGTSGRSVAGLRGEAARRRRRTTSRSRTRPATSTCAGRRSRPATGSAPEATAAAFQRRMAAHRRRVHPLRRRLLDVPRTQQRHDQGRWHLGVAGRGRGVLDRAPRRARGRGRRACATTAGWRRPSRSSSPRSGHASTRRRSTPTAASGWPRSSGRGSWSSSTSCRRPRPARSSASRSASNSSPHPCDAAVRRPSPSSSLPVIPRLRRDFREAGRGNPDANVGCGAGRLGAGRRSVA